MHILLTGATGYLGKHVAAQLLANGHTVTAIARGRNASPRQRVLGALQVFAADLPSKYGARLTVVEGDVALADCGLSVQALADIAANPIGEFIHCAGMTRFEEHLEAEVFKHNLGGTRHAYRLSKRLGARQFHHVSTAYVAGNSKREFGPADLAHEQAFNNPYEASKYAAEEFLHAVHADARHGIVIYRPAIVVGGHPIGDGNNVATVYSFLKALHFLRECFRRDLRRGRDRFSQHGVVETAAGLHLPMRVAASPHTSVHLVPVARVVTAIIARLGAKSTSLSTVQLTGTPHSLGSVRDAFCEVMRITGPLLVPPSDFDLNPRNSVEAHFFRLTKSYQAYLLSAPRFAKDANSAGESVDLVALAHDFLTEFEPAKPLRDSENVGALAVNLHGVRRARDYFDGLIQSTLGRHFLQQHRYINAAVRFQINNGERFDEIIEFANGRARYATDSTTHYDCAYTLTESLFLKVISGKADLRNAFFAGQVTISGNKEVALKFGSLLTQYYRDIDDNVIEEVAQ